VPSFNQKTSFVARDNPEEKVHPFMVILFPATNVVFGTIVGPDWKVGTVYEV